MIKFCYFINLQIVTFSFLLFESAPVCPKVSIILELKGIFTEV